MSEQKSNVYLSLSDKNKLIWKLRECTADLSKIIQHFNEINDMQFLGIAYNEAGNPIIDLNYEQFLKNKTIVHVKLLETQDTLASFISATERILEVSKNRY